MAKRGALVEVFPGVYQRGNFLSWPYAQKQALLAQYGITVVFNLWNKVDPDLSGSCLYVNWPIRGNAMPDNADAMVSLGAALLNRGERLLIHCEAGVNRSVWFCAAIIAQANNWSMDKALALAEGRIPRADPHRAFREEQEDAG